MSDAFLLVALGATFGCIVLVGIAIESTLTDRKRAVRLLESQVMGGDAGTNLREAELAEPFANRAIVPVMTGAARIARRLTPLDSRDRLAVRLVLAGSPPGWDAERMMAFKVIGAVAGLVLGVVMVFAGWLGGLAALVVTALFTFFSETFGSSSSSMMPLGADEDLLIFAVGSCRSVIFAVALRMYGAGTTSVSPKRWLKRCARSRVSSRCWRWSSPTGTWSAR